MRSAVGLLTTTLNEWFEDKAMRLGASLAFYAAFSLSPLLIIVVAIVDFIYGEDSSGYIRTQMENFIGRDAADAIMATIRTVNRSDGGAAATAIGIVTLLIGATAVFTELQDSMNTIWEVRPKPRRFITEVLRARVLSFAMVLGICFLLLVSLLFSALLAAISAYFQEWLPGTGFLWGFTDAIVSFAVTTLLFALIYKVLPDVHIGWSNVWIGAIFTSVLFTAGKIGIGIYLGQTAVASAYGAAGTILVVLAWVYYAAQILFLGAEFTQVYANHYGSRVRPARGAISLSEVERIHQGIPHAPTIEEAEKHQGGEAA